MPQADTTENGASTEAAFEGGSGPVLVLLHGLTGTWHIWKPVLRLLTPHHRVLALTLPGHRGGEALPNGVEPTVDVLADMLIADLRRRGIEQAHLAGNSLGGWLSLELARRGFALSVTALSPAGGWRTPEDYRAVSRPFRIIFALMPLLMILTGLFLGFAGIRRALNRQTMEHGDRLSASELFAAMWSVAKTRILPRLLKSMGRDGPIKPFTNASSNVRIAWSEEDKVIPFETYGKPLLEAVPGAERLIIPGVGHVPMYDDPERVAAVILATAAAAPAKRAA